jgi:hypothetical protein
MHVCAMFTNCVDSVLLFASNRGGGGLKNNKNFSLNYSTPFHSRFAGLYSPTR